MLRVSLLGEQVITDGASGAVRMRSSHTLALVGYLVVHAGAPQPRGRIAAAFWPDSTDGQALTNLRRELHQLRQALGDLPALTVTARDLTWRDTPECLVDVRAFVVECAATTTAADAGDDAAVLRHGAAALGHYGGDFLPGGYADWLLDARADLVRRCFGLCDLLITTRARTGDLPGAIEAARRRIGLAPTEEVGYRTLMELQADLGDRSGAVSTYHHCASVLERELGVDPDHTTRACLQQLLTRKAPEPLAEPAAPPVSEPVPVRSGPAVATLIGRARELAVLTAAWDRCCEGRPGLAVVAGDAGVGKTRLVSDLTDRARVRGAVVVTSRCFGGSSRLALAPVADWLRHPAIRPSLSTLDPVWRAEVDRLVPTDGGSSVADPAMVDGWQRHRFFEGLARALLGVGRPTLLVLDDLQWCDEETLDFLGFCLGLTTDAPLFVAGTARNEGGGPHLDAWKTRMRATGLHTEVALDPLTPADTAALAAAISGRPVDDADAELLHATTGGFPLHVVEAARTVVGHLHPGGGLDAVLGGRLEQASPPAQEVATLAAAVGRNFGLDLLTEASDLDADTVVSAVDELWRLRIVRELGDGYDFTHDLLRDAAYARIQPAGRWLTHRRLAQALELLYRDDTDAVSADLAEQYARGGRAERAVGFYRRAAAVAAARCANAEAIRLLSTALELVRSGAPGTSRDQQELLVLETIAGPLTARLGYASAEVQQVLEQSIALAESLGRKDSVLTGLNSLWSSRFVQGDITGSYDVAARAFAMVDPDSERSGLHHFALAGSMVSLGRPAEALEHFEHALTHTRGTGQLMTVGSRPEVHGTAWSAHAHWLLGDDAAAEAAAREAVAVARRIDHPFSVAVALAYQAMTDQMRGDLPSLSAGTAELREHCDRHEFAYYGEWGLIFDGWARADAAGLDLVRHGLDRLRSGSAFTRMPYWLSLVADLQSRLGDPRSAQATLDAALATGQARKDYWWLPEVLRLRAAYDEPGAREVRLRAAAAMAAEHGSVALLRRCENDLREG